MSRPLVEMTEEDRQRMEYYGRHETLGEIRSYLESHHGDNTIKLEEIGINLTKDQLDALFVLAVSFVPERGCQYRGMHDCRSSSLDCRSSSEIHLLLLKTLLQNGADISIMWRPVIQNHPAPFVEMFFRREGTALEDIEFFIKEKDVPSKLQERDLGRCFVSTLLRQNIPLLRLLIDNGVIMPSASVLGHLDDYYGRKFHFGAVGQILDLVVDGKTTVDLGKVTPLRGITPEVPATVLQWPISQLLSSNRDELEKLDYYEECLDILLGKGHLAPPPEAFTCAICKGSLTFIFVTARLCLTRGIDLEFPNLRKEDKSEFNWDDADDRTKKIAVLLEELIHRSGCYCPHSFLLTLCEIRRAGPKFPSLQNMSVAAIRKYLLVPDKDKEEGFPDSIVVLRDIPVKPRLIFPREVQSMLPLVMCDLVLLKDLRKDVEAAP